jgi:hypothetical protein
LKNVTPPAAYPRIAEDIGKGASPAAVATVGGLVGAGIGAVAVMASRIGRDKDDSATGADKKPK